jgi:hypothetical protein
MATSPNEYSGSWWDDDDDETSWAELRQEAIEKGWILPANTTTSTTSTTKTIEPPVDKDGNILTEGELNEALMNLTVTRLNIDEDVRRIKDPEEQANACKQLEKRYRDLEKDLKGKLDDLRKWNRSRFTDEGVEDYGLESVEENRAVTEMVDDEVGWYEDELRVLKDELAERIQMRIDDLRAKGLDMNDRVRDRIYESLVDEEVIEAWEPLEF